MVFGRNMIPVEQVDRHAPRESDAWYLAMMAAAFPGSWLPFGQEQVIRCASPHFRLVSGESGRLDYIETIRQWDMRTGAWHPRLALMKLRLIPKWLTSKDFRFAFTAGESSNQSVRARADRPLPTRVRESVIVVANHHLTTAFLRTRACPRVGWRRWRARVGQ